MPSQQESTVFIQARPKALWTPSSPEQTNLHRFLQIVQEKYSLNLPGYHQLWKWSIEHSDLFWKEIYHFTSVKTQTSYELVQERQQPLFPKPIFFKGSQLNFAENLLFPSPPPPEDSYAVIAATESKREYVTWKDLRERVRHCATAMREMGLKPDDRVAGYVGNHSQTLVAMLAATSIGALWTSVSPDTGVHAVLERLQQIEPVLLFADIASEYNGKIHDAHVKVVEIAGHLPSLKKVVVFATVKEHPFNVQEFADPGKVVGYSGFISDVKTPASPLTFEYLPPDHPVYILYSSGTTGPPKPIVHGAMGTLIQHKKEHVLHCDVSPGDRLFYYTTTTWMMWHWLVSALASGVAVVLYDGSPFRPFDLEGGRGEMAMPRLLDELQVTHFGTSAKYLSIIEQAALNPTAHPERPVSLEKLRVILSTGSTLAPSTFDYVYSKFKSDVMLGSITGGTDIISLFGACCPILPVYKGEIQCRGLGMAVSVCSYDGQDISGTDEAGDLICTSSFPSQPVMFWPPGPEGAEIYRKSYFDKFGPDVWHHGDFLHLKTSTGGLEMLGRSDGVLKPAGVRFGSAEIYNVVLGNFADVIEDSLCVGRRRKEESDETVVLFVKLADGSLNLSNELAARIKAKIREELSPRHVPGFVDACAEIPFTSNGKKVENVVKQILCGLNIKTGASVANPGCLEFYREWNKRH
ncbi:hypothetical protein KEM54_002429 [Ascosphaera aggregata]|nr:hypothetical protein KEM54_002429 [Ascosphaera aggregata]